MGLFSNLFGKEPWMKDSFDKIYGDATFNLENGQTSNYALSIRQLNYLAEKGYARAYLTLADCYISGQGVTIDYATALNYLNKGMDAHVNDRYAYHLMGTLYHHGCGVEKNHAKALAYYQRAIDAGYHLSWIYIGDMYLSGEGMAQDSQKAIEAYKKAISEGAQIDGYLRLGDMYANGLGVPQEKIVAKNLYQYALSWFGSYEAEDKIRKLNL